MKAHTRQFSLCSAQGAWWGRVAFGLIIGLVVALLGQWTVWAALSAWVLEHPGRNALALALALDPANPNLHHRLALLRIYQGSFQNWEFQQALDSLERAAALAPQSAAIWTDLAIASSSLADSAGTRRALRQALALDAMTPRLQWFAANFYAGANETEASFSHLQRLLEMDPRYAAEVFRLGSRLAGTPSLLETRLMPRAHQPQLRLALLEFLVSQDRLDLAPPTWQAIVAAGARFPFALVQPYVERLIAAGDVEQTTRVWGHLAALGVVAAAEPDNVVTNGDFEHPPLGAGLDWRWFPQRGVWLDFGDPRAYSGDRSLRVDFVEQRNEQYELVTQIVPVCAGETYRLTAWAQSEAITSDSGPRLRVSDPNCSGCTVTETPMITGTAPWQPMEVEFTAGPAQRFVRLSLWRARSRTFPTQISGRLWLDRVSLRARGRPKVSPS